MLRLAVLGFPCMTQAASGIAASLQAFNWESHKKRWYKDMIPKVPEWAKEGFTCIWLPPPSDSVSPQVCCWSSMLRMQH